MAGMRDFLVRAALILAILLPIYFLVAALGTKFGLLDWRIGFGLMTYTLGKFVLMGVGAIGLLATLATILVKPRMKGLLGALLAVLLPAAGMGYGVYVQSQAKDIPPIHDISTSLDDPPSFTELVLQERAKVPCVNTLDFATKTVGAANGPGCRGRDGGPLAKDLHAKAYGDLKPLRMNQAPNDAVEMVLDAAAAQGWTIVNADVEGGLIEATASTFWYGFKDDIAVRLRPTIDGLGTIVDVRSVSRVGVSDLGANAARIRAFLAAVDSEQAKAATGG
jgi:uncharacterized protein (DUF1499 family)